MAKTKNPELERRRKDQILATACQLLEQGTHRALTLDRVAQEAGVSKGMVTYYFRSKDQLIVQAIERLLDAQRQAMETIVRAPGPIAVRLQRLVEAALPDRSALAQQLSLQAEVWSFAKQSPETLAAVRQSYLRFRSALEQLVDVGVAEGYVTAPDARALYLLLHALIDGVSFHLVLDEELDVAEVRRRIVRLVDTLLTDTSTRESD